MSEVRKVLVTQRLKRSGQSWGRDGGHGVLSFRALLKSDRVDRAWPMAVPRMERSKKHWDPVKTAANDNWVFGVAARCTYGLNLGKSLRCK